MQILDKPCKHFSIVCERLPDDLIVSQSLEVLIHGCLGLYPIILTISPILFLMFLLSPRFVDGMGIDNEIYAESIQA